jgi:hypothetical protein
MSRWISVIDAVDLRLLGSGDFQKRDRLRLTKWAKFVWQDMNLTTIKRAIRQRFTINRKTRSIDMPCEFLQFCSVNVEDECGNEIPVYRNPRVKDDLVDVSAAKNCNCEYKCGYKLCNTIKGYEAIKSVKSDYLPSGSIKNFDCVDRKGIDDQGFFYQQLQYPQRIYESTNGINSVWIDTVLHTENKKLCKVELDENGCCCDSEANIDAVCHACGIDNVNPDYCCIGGTASKPPTETCNTWTYYCNSKLDWFSIQCGGFPRLNKECNNVYNISELGDRIIFPHNFGWEKVILRWYEDTGLDTLQIPVIAVDTFVFGLMWWDCQFNDNKQPLGDKYGRMYATRKFGLLKELNKYRVAELGKIVTPSRFIPSYVYSRTNQSESGYVRNIYTL